MIIPFGIVNGTSLYGTQRRPTGKNDQKRRTTTAAPAHSAPDTGGPCLAAVAPAYDIGRDATEFTGPGVTSHFGLPDDPDVQRLSVAALRQPTGPVT